MRGRENGRLISIDIARNTKQCVAVLVVIAGTCVCWNVVHMCREVYAERLIEWESEQWWWRQCADMQFYEEVQGHMDKCDRLRVVDISQIHWTVVHDVMLSIWDSIILMDLHETFVASTLAAYRAVSKVTNEISCATP